MQSNPKQKCGLGQDHNLQPKYGIRFKILIFENHIKFHSKFQKIRYCILYPILFAQKFEWNKSQGPFVLNFHKRICLQKSS